MRLDNYVNLQSERGASGLFFACGSFGMVDGGNYTVQTDGNKTVYCHTDESICLTATFTEQKNGVMIRRDTFQNLTDEPMELHGLVSRFQLDGNAYEVYTQFNGWQHESSGGWQPLVTQVTAAASGIRTCDGATPMMALNNLYTNKNTVFHLLPNAQWKMTARKFPTLDKELVVVETGFQSEGLRLSVAPHEVIELPTVIFFSAESKTDLDAYKLHEVYNELHPRRAMPVLYNSWLYRFDDLDVDALLEQADVAAALGIEAFMIDAGWFGEGESWAVSVGDWEENTVSGPKGRLAEISERVRQNGMIFGLWFEPERAGSHCKNAAAHPDYYIDGTFLDFANPDAVAHMLRILSEQIDKYKIGWVKFDFNATIPLDPSGNGFYRYMQGQKQFLQALHQRYPALYITNCASGGARMELEQGTMTDSFWLSDNQGPLGGLDIVKNTLKRMPTALIERWNVQKYCDGFPRYGEKGTVGLMFNCNDGTWESVSNVRDSFAEAFMCGGPMGFSGDLANFPPQYAERWRSVIAQYKQDRAFYIGATARILVDTDQITVIQYADPALTRLVLQVFTKTARAHSLIVYPCVTGDRDYRVEDTVRCGRDLLENGIAVRNLQINDCRVIELTNV